MNKGMYERVGPAYGVDCDPSILRTQGPVSFEEVPPPLLPKKSHPDFFRRSKVLTSSPLALRAHAFSLMATSLAALSGNCAIMQTSPAHEASPARNTFAREPQLVHP